MTRPRSDRDGRGGPNRAYRRRHGRLGRHHDDEEAAIRPATPRLRTAAARRRPVMALVGLAALVSASCGGTERTMALPTASLPGVASATPAVAPAVPPSSSEPAPADVPTVPEASLAASAPATVVAAPSSAVTGAAPPPTAAAPPPAPAPTPVAAPPPAPPASGEGFDVRAADMYSFGCGDDEAKVAASGAARVTLGSATVYAGALQVNGNNQDPRVVRFDNGVQSWCREDLERNDDDGRAFGVAWSGDMLYVVFSATGTQGDASGDLRRFTQSGWLKHYSDASPGGGGGGKVSVIVRLDPATGDGVSGSWLTALNGTKTNSLVVTSVGVDAAGLTVTANSGYQPRGADRKALACGDGPFVATYRFSHDLTTATEATSTNC